MAFVSFAWVFRALEKSWRGYVKVRRGLLLLPFVAEPPWLEQNLHAVEAQ